MFADEDPYLTAIGWCLLQLENNPDRLELLADLEDTDIVLAMSQMLIAMLSRDGAGEPREVLLSWQRIQLELLTKTEDHQHD